MNTVEDVGGSQRLKGLFAKLQRELPGTIFQVGATMAAEAAARAPTPEEEFATMMLGSGNPEGLELVGGPGQADDGDHRVRFEKPVDLYLQPVIAQDFEMIDNMVVGIGEMTKLNTASHYSWTNINGDTFTSFFPFWECWEGGMDGTFYIHPTHSKKSSLLVPAPGETRATMTKTIPARGMFKGVDIEYYVEQNLIPAVERIAREA